MKHTKKKPSKRARRPQRRTRSRRRAKSTSASPQPEAAEATDASESGTAPAPEPELHPQHLALITGSAIANDVAQARGYRTVTSRAELRRLGFSDSQCRVPALLVPVWGVTGEIASYQIRPDQPRVVDGKALKYETPKGSRMVLDVPPSARPWLGDPSRPLFITEGARKADSAVSVGLCTIALLGVWNWRGTNDQGGLTALADWESIALKEREIFVAFDSDVVTKSSVRAALVRLRAFLEQRGARVRLLVLPSGEGGKKVGLDDFLASGKTKDDLLACASINDQPSEEKSDSESLYGETEDGRIVFRKPLPSGGYTPIILSNFTARIVADVVVDDGVETRRAFQIQGKLAGKPEVMFEVPSERFGAMNWPIEHLGPKATVCAGFGNRDRLREAIQTLSSDAILRLHTYTHIGFRQINREWVFLHAGGGIGARGAVAGIRVRLDPPLDRFVLPPPPEGEELVLAVRKSLGLLDGLASDGTMFPLFSANYGAPLGDTNASLHAFGKTGRRKSEIVSLIQRHYGESMDAEHLPGSWTSTGNAQEALAFLAKDSVLVLDDFNPTGNVHDIRRAHAGADRIFRAQGNQSARQRMHADGSLRPPKPPRGQIISTGEDVPAGHSLRARVFLLEFRENEVNLDRLTECQRDAAYYPKAMAAYVSWVAARRDALREERKQFITEQRRTLSDAPHGRTATIGVSLLFGLICALRFARESHAIDEATEKQLLERGRRAILDAVAGQTEHHEAADPVKVFPELLGDAIQSGAAHVADVRTGGVPELDGDEHAETAHLLGWRLVESTDGTKTRTEWRPGGELVGWVDVEAGDVYLLPQAAYDAAQRMAESSPTRITLGPRMLAKTLDEAGFLVTKDDDDGRRTKKYRVAGKPRSVWHTRIAHLFGEPGTTGTARTAPVPDAAAAPACPAGVPTTAWSEGGTGTPSGNGVAAVAPIVPVVPAAGEPGDDPDREAREERAAILEHEAGATRAEAEVRAGLFPETSVRDPEASGSVG